MSEISCRAWSFFDEELTTRAYTAPVAFITGGAFTPEASAFIESAVFPVLRKPFSKTDVLRIVERLGSTPVNERPFQTAEREG